MRGFPNILNIRSLGGIPAKDGSLIRAGKLFRSAELGDASKAEQQLLARTYRVRTIIDLRTGFERRPSPDPDIEGVENVLAPLLPMKTLGVVREDYNWTEMLTLRWNPDDYDMRRIYEHFVDPATSDEWQTIFQVLLDNHDGAVLWHCTNGKDRTGAVAAILLSALGVRRADIIEGAGKGRQARVIRPHGRPTRCARGIPGVDVHGHHPRLRRGRGVLARHLQARRGRFATAALPLPAIIARSRIRL